MEWRFDNIDDLIRDRKIEGEVGINLKIKEGIILLVRAASDANPLWKAKAPKALREIARLRNNGATDAVLNGKIAELYADTLVFGWHGGQQEDGTLLPGGPIMNGQIVPFSRDACVGFLTIADDAIDALWSYCRDTQNFREARNTAVVDETVKS